MLECNRIAIGVTHLLNPFKIYFLSKILLSNVIHLCQDCSGPKTISALLSIRFLIASEIFYSDVNQDALVDKV